MKRVTVRLLNLVRACLKIKRKTKERKRQDGKNAFSSSLSGLRSRRKMNKDIFWEAWKEATVIARLLRGPPRSEANVGPLPSYKRKCNWRAKTKTERPNTTGTGG